MLIDLHCHILPAMDDGSPDLATSIEMARIAVDDGIEIIACTPHIMSGVYDNVGDGIRKAIRALAAELASADIQLDLVSGADIHVTPNLVDDFRSGRFLTLNQSRYFLLEPPHHVLPPRLMDLVFALISADYVPILTHPERLSWIDGHYDIITRLGEAGVLMQITGGSLTGRFGRKARYWAERMLDEGKVHILATDGHDAKRRPPVLSEARDVVSKRLGEDIAKQLVVERPRSILENRPRSEISEPKPNQIEKRGRFWRWARGIGKD